PIVGDMNVESDETFSVVIASQSGITVAKSTGSGTIMNDDAEAVATLTLSTSALSLVAGMSDDVFVDITPSPGAQSTLHVFTTTPNIVAVTDTLDMNALGSGRLRVK